MTIQVPNMPTRFCVAVVPGEQPDHTTIAIVEALNKRSGANEPVYRHFLLSDLERFPLGTAWSEIAGRVREIVKHPKVACQCLVVTPAFCVAPHLARYSDYPLLDILRNGRLGCAVSVVTIPGVDPGHQTGLAWNPAQRSLVAAVRSAIENGEMQISPKMGKLGENMRRLLATADEGGYDDRFFAIALATWRAHQTEKPVAPPRRVTRVPTVVRVLHRPKPARRKRTAAKSPGKHRPVATRDAI